jgi:hypothetical protein
VEKGEIVVGEKDTETGLRVLGQHKPGGFQIEMLEERMVSGFEIDPVKGDCEGGIVAVLFVLGQRIKVFGKSRFGFHFQKGSENTAITCVVVVYNLGNREIVR